MTVKLCDKAEANIQEPVRDAATGMPSKAWPRPSSGSARMTASTPSFAGLRND
jgi:hypothetical protein